MSGVVNPARAVILGDGSDATKKLSIITNMDGTFTIARGEYPSTTQDIALVDANGNWIPQQPGSVIQTIVHTNAGDTGITGTSWANRTSVPATITPRSTNSNILVRVSFYTYPGAYASGVNYHNLRLYESNTTPIGLTASAGTLGASNVQAMYPGCLSAIVGNSALSTRSFTIWSQMNAASGTGAVSNQVWELMEIAA